jgi:phosphate/sulfate permease
MVRVTDADGATDLVEFTVTKKALPTPLRMSPEGSTLRSGIVTFRWQGIASGSGITYIVEISQSPSFITGVMSESAGTELSYTLPKERALSKGTYYWRVKAVDDYSNESEFSASDYSTFTVSPIPTWVWVVVGVVVLIGLMVVAYRETKFKVAE